MNKEVVTGLMVLIVAIGVCYFFTKNEFAKRSESFVPSSGEVSPSETDFSYNAELEELGRINQAQYEAYNSGKDIYLNSQYGFQFAYNAEVARVVVNGNRIETVLKDFWSDTENPGPYLEFFPKDPNMSFVDAIRKTILTEYPSPYCKVNLYNSNTLLSEKGLQAATINDYDPQGFKTPFQTMGNCGYDYVASNSPGEYFFYDPSHPNVFFYYRSGQSAFHLIATFGFK